jgi:hypothetical protein
VNQVFIFISLCSGSLTIIYQKRHCGQFLKSSAVHHLAGQTSIYATVFHNEEQDFFCPVVSMHNTSENRCNPNHLAIFSFPGGVSDISTMNQDGLCAS